MNGGGGLLLKIADSVVVLLQELGLLRQQVAAGRADDGHDVLIHPLDGIQQRLGSVDDSIFLTLSDLENCDSQAEADHYEQREDGEGAP